VYGQAATISEKESADLNGKLNTTLTERMLPDSIRFSLQSIRDTYDVDARAQALADYMTVIANTTGWSNTSNSQLKGLYLDFINANSEGTGLMGGSAAQVKAYVEALRDQLKGNEDDLSKAIVANIEADTKSCLGNGYPSASTSLRLPDGAAALRWINGAFSVRTRATTLDNINGINRWAYPAELWYYANSGILTSEEDVAKTTYSSQEQWSSLLTDYYTAGNTITGVTRSVAVEQPLQYGVARLQITLNQITVGFDFKPKEPESDVDARFIYDTVVGSADVNGKYTVNTLVLQSYDGERVPVVLEFKNDTGHKFTGKDGIIYPGTKFYLIAQIDPANGTGEDGYDNRVFTQDRTTKMTMIVNSLKNAYSCMPDLLSPRLEIGVQVTTTWIQPTTTTVIL
jgi:hypothetical protein